MDFCPPSVSLPASALTLFSVFFVTIGFIGFALESLTKLNVLNETYSKYASATDVRLRVGRVRADAVA